MAVNKVELADGTSLIDITDSTVEASDVAAGKVFYTAAGVRTVGTAPGSDPLDAYPIGTIYQSMNSTSPAELFGGYWNPIKGQFILAAAEESDIGTEPDLSVCYRTAGATGGSERVTLSEAQMPDHTHGLKWLSGSVSVRPLSNKTSSLFASPSGIVTTPRSAGTFSGGVNFTGIDNTKGWDINVNATHEHDSVGGGESHGNMPPYIAAYTWVRVEPPEELGA